MNKPNNIILQAVMGSHAYGLATPSSDEDRKGIFVVPCMDLTGLHPPKDTWTHTDPDHEFHEIGKFFRLALKCNPTVLEQLFTKHYEILTPEGRSVISARHAFLSAPRVLGSFGGYAMDQMRRLQQRGDGSFSSDVRNRRNKHALHMIRLMWQGRDLLKTGIMHVRLANSQIPVLRELSQQPDDVLIETFEREDTLLREAYDNTVLPEKPDEEYVDWLLRSIRKKFID